MANVIYFSIIELLCGFRPTSRLFIILRALFGIGMGGEWGVGASLAMEAAPVRWRGSSQRNSAEWLFDWLSLGRDSREVSPARVGMAPHVLDWRAARITCAVHSHESAGIRSMESNTALRARARFCASLRENGSALPILSC